MYATAASSGAAEHPPETGIRHTSCHFATRTLIELEFATGIDSRTGPK